MTDEPEVSLEALSQSFARLFGNQPVETASDTHSESSEPPPAQTQPLAVTTIDEEPAADVSPRSILEAMLFVGSPDNAPLSAERAAGVMRGVEAAEIHELVIELNESYRRNRCPYVIKSEGAGYRLVLRDEYQRLRDKFYGRVRQARLSQAAIEVLALVAYHEPLTSEEVARLRNVPSGAVLAQLVRRQLLRVERSEEEPRTPRYYTTQRFLDLFGLESRADLPQAQDLN
jgi:segregation and condensation protein B